MVDAEFIARLVREALPQATVKATDTTGQGDHWHVVIIDPTFAGERTFQRQKRVLPPFRAYLADNTIHALDLVTLTPDEAARR